MGSKETPVHGWLHSSMMLQEAAIELTDLSPQNSQPNRLHNLVTFCYNINKNMLNGRDYIAKVTAAGPNG
jgi:hypothetical protein